MTNDDRPLIALIILAIIIGVAIGILASRPALPVSPLSPLAVPALARTPTPQPTPVVIDNLVINPNFAEPYHGAIGKDNIRTAWGWEATWKAVPPCRPLTPGCSLPCPDSCLKNPTAAEHARYEIDAVGKWVTVTLVLSGVQDVQSVDIIGVFSYTQMHLENVQSPVTATLHYTQPYTTYAGVGMFYWYSGRNPSGEITPAITGTYRLMTLTFSRLWWYEPEVSLIYFLGNSAGGMAGSGKLTAQRCTYDTGCYWAEPECAPINYGQAYYRAYAGESAQKCFVYGRMGEWTLYSQITTTPGVMTTFAAMLEGWQCYDWATCCANRPTCISDAPATMGLRVGIDPTGGTDPDADTVVWGETGDSFDKFGRFAVTARATGVTATVFVGAGPRFNWTRMHNDMYAGWAYAVEQRNEVYLPFVTCE